MQARYVLLTAPWGGIVNDPVLLRLAEDRFWLALADSDALLYLAGVAGARGMDVAIFEADVAPMQIQGPRSKDVIRDLFGDAVADLRYYFCAEAEVDGIPVVVSRTGWTGEVGFEVYLQDPSRGDELFERVFQAGEPYGIRVIAPSEARRIEAGIFNYGSDIRVEDTPLHVSGLERYVEWDQEEDFIGRGGSRRSATATCSTASSSGSTSAGEPMTDEGALNDFWTAGQGRRAARPGDGRRVVAAAGAEHRLRVGADPLGGAGLDVRGRDPARARPGDGREPPVRRSRQGHPEGVASGDVSDSDPLRPRGRVLRPTRADLGRGDGPHDRAGGAELRGRGRVLEVGVGTGLLALPLHEAGIPVVGPRPLGADARQARREGGGRAAVPARPRRRDAHAVRRRRVRRPRYLRWVLHLIPDWRGVARRDRPRGPSGAGVLLVYLGAYGGSRARDPAPVRARSRACRPSRSGLSWWRPDELDAELAGLGAPAPASCPRSSRSDEEPLGEFLDGIEENRYSWTWPVPEDVRRRRRPRSSGRGPRSASGRSTASSAIRVETVWRAYDLP